jgi:hypothetical protein
MDLAAAPHPSSLKDLPCPLPPAASGEPTELAYFRKQPGQRRPVPAPAPQPARDRELGRALATLLVLHASSLRDPAKVAELSFQAYELWNDRAKDKAQAAHALVRALQAQPDNVRPFDLLRRLYEQLGAHQELATLLRWRIDSPASRTDRAAVPAALVELGTPLRAPQIFDIPEACALYRKALELAPGDRNASEAADPPAHGRRRVAARHRP